MSFKSFAAFLGLNTGLISSDLLLNLLDRWRKMKCVSGRLRNSSISRLDLVKDKDEKIWPNYSQSFYRNKSQSSSHLDFATPSY